ncbi:YciE/YciF ferroxidase family protein [Kaistella palustris]|uniref:YciE/YciF ferroxidase family protein n=1 Tax=Kaistella palustris TaxID=493376 RepID=UPI00040147FE|nr:ferritin-like domain-containing protein [Kaistella palustris]
MAKSTSSDKKSAATSKTSSKSAGSTTKAPKKSASAGKIRPEKDAAENLREFLVDGIKDLYWAEKALVKNLPKMAKNATSPKLVQAINKHLQETETQVTRLEGAFKALGEKVKAQKCDAMDGLLKEAESIMKETEPGAVRDAAIIAAAQKVEHYEIASYGTMATYAKLLGEKEALNLLKETLGEEKNCDTDLTKLAISEINIKAKNS